MEEEWAGYWPACWAWWVKGILDRWLKRCWLGSECWETGDLEGGGGSLLDDSRL